jgi:hypothetical protein
MVRGSPEVFSRRVRVGGAELPQAFMTETRGDAKGGRNRVADVVFLASFSYLGVVFAAAALGVFR